MKTTEEAADMVLRAAGSSLANYTMPSVREAIFAAVRAVQKDAAAQWLPLSTSPKDGREFLVLMPRCGNVISLVRWAKLHKHWLCKGESIWLHDGDLWADLPEMPNGECYCGALTTPPEAK